MTSAIVTAAIPPFSSVSIILPSFHMATRGSPCTVFNVALPPPILICFFRSFAVILPATTWYVRIFTSMSLFSGFSSVSTVPAGSFANASFVGANTVNGPAPSSVSTKPAAFTAATSVVWSCEFTAFSTIFFEGYIAAPPTIGSFCCANPPGTHINVKAARAVKILSFIVWILLYRVVCQPQVVRVRGLAGCAISPIFLLCAVRLSRRNPLENRSLAPFAVSLARMLPLNFTSHSPARIHDLGQTARHHHRDHISLSCGDRVACAQAVHTRTREQIRAGDRCRRRNRGATRTRFFQRAQRQHRASAPRLHRRAGHRRERFPRHRPDRPHLAAGHRLGQARRDSQSPAYIP